MMQMEVSEFINTFVGAFFPLFSDPKLGLLFNIDASYTDMGYERTEEGSKKVRDEFHFRCTMLYLITRPMNNAHIYTRIMPPLEKFDIMYGTDMRLVSTHNSCWMDAVKRVSQDAEMLCMDQYRSLEDYEDRPAWAHINSHVNFSVFQKPTFLLLHEPKRTGEDYCEEGTPHGRWHMQAEKVLTTMQDVAVYMNKKASNYTAWH